jgi:flagellar motor switch protein FliN/FliY
VSPESIAQSAAADLEYSRVWAENVARNLEQLHGTAFVATVKPADDAASANAVAPVADAGGGEKLWINFKVSGKLAGEMAFHFSTADGVRLAQMLTSEPVDAAAVPNESHTDALNELFRQFAGTVATNCKTKYGGAVEFELESALVPAWKPASQASWIFAAPQVAPLQWTLLTSVELHAALLAVGEMKAQNTESARAQSPAAQDIAPAQPPKAPLAQPAASFPAAAPASSSSTPGPAARVHAVGVVAATVPPASSAGGNGSNLDLLLDVELDASLRFGQREMSLREILELRPGSVVELNRQLQEPAELLVGGRIIARGEVVIVDGNYGLRITDIVQPEKRLGPCKREQLGRSPHSTE